MTGPERIRRHKPERTSPIRNWSTLFGPPDSSGRPPSGFPPGSGALGETVSRSVELGYRVIDEYIRQGQKAAQRFSDRSFDPRTAQADFEELGMRMAQYASDFASLWFELVNLRGAGFDPAATGPAPQATPARPSSPAPASAPEPEPTRVRIEVASARPVEVSLDLRPEAADRPLLVHALRAVDPETPRLDRVAFQPATDGEAPALRVQVPPELPPGTYSGLLVDPDTSRPAGTVSVSVGEEPAG